MVSVFSPATKSVSPEISTVASGSVVSTSTSTDSVNASSSTVSPTAVLLPSTKTSTTVASLFKFTYKVT